ncbi:MAG: AmmeMemoRadiSam system radical SAM enzyme [Methanomassiliicoccales archaeon]|nr:AmmeMemoRadiSam system radical SAM enzyme [Methanomassiliicoccales archaeon]
MSISGEKGRHEARFWKVEGDRAACYLCPHHCKIAEGKVGVCGVRQNIGGRLYSLIYGRASSINVDPIEKKPLFHFLPGEGILSLGSVGCNLHCLHCQNFTISQAKTQESFLESMAPEDVSRLATSSGCRAIAFTYNEPTIWHEFTYDACKIAKEKDQYTVYVTNGFIEEEPLRDIAPYLDAMNIDVKGFKEAFYKDVCRARLDPVLKATKLAHDLGIHIELTYLVIPGKNDDEDEMRAFSRWVSKSISEYVPVHFTRFHPDYMMTDVPPTPISTMELAQKIGKEEGLKFVYGGNYASGDGENTRCPKCGTLIVRRTGYHIHRVNLTGPDCPKCGEHLYFVL